jgi:hypothetical protein
MNRVRIVQRDNPQIRPRERTATSSHDRPTQTTTANAVQADTQGPRSKQTLSRFLLLPGGNTTTSLVTEFKPPLRGIRTRIPLRPVYAPGPGDFPPSHSSAPS